MNPKLKNGHFWKFQRHEFSTIICDQNAKFWGLRVKNGHSRAKNVIFRGFRNYWWLRNSNHVNEYSSFSFYPINAYDSLKWPEEACPDNIFGKICDFYFSDFWHAKTPTHKCFLFFCARKIAKAKITDFAKNIIGARFFPSFKAIIRVNRVNAEEGVFVNVIRISQNYWS